MIILDTNVISELIKARPSRKVISWFERQSPQPLATTAITAAELWYGLNAMPEGKRRRALQEAVTDMLEKDFGGAILPFDLAAAEAFGFLAARLKALGRPAGHNDTMIAAIALSRDGVLVTRNDRHFRDSGVRIVNPF